jgi:hypothetical protein
MEFKSNIEKLIISDAHFFNKVDSLGNKPHLFGGKIKDDNDTTQRSLDIYAKNIIVNNSKIYL